MVLLPSMAITVENEPIAWGFLGPDGSLTSLHCEVGYSHMLDGSFKD